MSQLNDDFDAWCESDMLDDLFEAEIYFKSKSVKNMSQLPKITIADLLTGTRVGMLTARITEVSVFTQLSKYATPANSTVNVYKLNLLDGTGEINYSDWCKKPNVQRSYKKGQIIRFHHAKLKPSTNVDPNTGQLYPPNVTVEKSTIIELLNEDGTAPVPKNLTPAVVQPVASVSLPPIASSPVPQTAVIPQAVGPEYLIVKAQYPNFYGFMDNLLNKLYDMLTDQQQTFVDSNYSLLMNAIWGP